jgi:proteasome accessory factor B
VVGYDRDRQARRSFRLSRIEGGVRRIGPTGSYQAPAELDAAELVAPAPEPRDERTAVLRVRAGRAVLLRHRALDGEPASKPGWDLLTVAVGDVTDLASEIAGYGSDVVVLEPADLRMAVVRVLTAVIAAAELPPDLLEREPVGRSAP